MTKQKSYLERSELDSDRGFAVTFSRVQVRKNVFFCDLRESDLRAVLQKSL